VNDIASQISERVKQAAADGGPLRICGGNSKAFYGRQIEGDPLDVNEHRGIVNYAPTELVLTARAGTPLQEVEQTLAEKQQMLAFEPPHFADAATLGGTIACGLSGPRRPYNGAARDFVLGSRLINGKGEHLHFGGEVMKNVAGYDISRLLTGSLGTLGVITEVSLKVLPVPFREQTLVFEYDPQTAIQKTNEWAGKPLPVSATCHLDDRLYVRLSGSDNGVKSARNKLGGEIYENGAVFWRELREHRLDFFKAGQTLWRISVPAASPVLPLKGDWIIEWGGALRWFVGTDEAAKIRATVQDAGGHASMFRGGDRTAEVFHPLARGIRVLHQNLKNALDPSGIFNRGKMYADM